MEENTWIKGQIKAQTLPTLVLDYGPEATQETWNLQQMDRRHLTRWSEWRRGTGERRRRGAGRWRPPTGSCLDAPGGGASPWRGTPAQEAWRILPQEQVGPQRPSFHHGDRTTSGSPAPRHGVSRSGGGLLDPCWGVGEAGGGGAGPLVEPRGEGAALLVLRELWSCGSSGATSPPPVGPLLTRCRGGGGANEVEEVGFPPPLGGHLLLTGDGGGFVGRGGVWMAEVGGGAGALARRHTAGGGRMEEQQEDGGS